MTPKQRIKENNLLWNNTMNKLAYCEESEQESLRQYCQELTEERNKILVEG